MNSLIVKIIASGNPEINVNLVKINFPFELSIFAGKMMQHHNSGACVHTNPSNSKRLVLIGWF